MMMLGLFLMILGGKYYSVTMFISGQASVSSFILIIMFTSVFPVNSPIWGVWLTLMVSLGMGAGIGFAAQRWSRIGVLIIGTWIGGLFGAILYTLFFYLFSSQNPLLILWMTIIFCSVIIAVLSMIFFDHAVCIGSSLGGAYVFVRVSLINITNILGVFIVCRRIHQRVLNLLELSKWDIQPSATHLFRLPWGHSLSSYLVIEVLIKTDETSPRCLQL